MEFRCGDLLTCVVSDYWHLTRDKVYEVGENGEGDLYIRDDTNLILLISNYMHCFKVAPREEEDVTTFKVGDVVKLKCGGPKMIVSYIADDEFTYVWFNTLHNYNEGYFNINLLLKEN